MKKIIFLFAAICTLVACDPVQEDIDNAGSLTNITLETLKNQTSVSLDKSADGQWGNVLTCNTTAPVNARWLLDGKQVQLGNHLWKKLKVGEHVVTMEALCKDGTLLKADYPLNVQTITNKLTKYIVYGPVAEGDELVGVETSTPLVMNQGNAAAGRFSDNEGQGLPFLTDEVYWGFKTLIFDMEAAPGQAGIWGEPAGPCMIRVMNGHWSVVYADGVEFPDGRQLWELTLTEEIAKTCASKSSGGEARDLDILVRRGTITVYSVYYEE